MRGRMSTSRTLQVSSQRPRDAGPDQGPCTRVHRIGGWRPRHGSLWPSTGVLAAVPVPGITAGARTAPWACVALWVRSGRVGRLSSETSTAGSF